MRRLLAALGLSLATSGALADVPQTQIERAAGFGRGQQGLASFYGLPFHGRSMANGRVFDRWGHSAASRTLPLGTLALVTNTHNGRREIVRIEDRGPYVRGRIIDLSQGTARRLGMEAQGLAWVTIDPLPSGP